MGSDVKQSLAAAEKLLKAGNDAEAIAAFDRVVDESKGDLLTVNRVGDAIVSAGEHSAGAYAPGKADGSFLPLSV